MATEHADNLVWYVAYGSNLLLERFRCYLAGGRPPGAARTYRGCRDRADPVRVRPVEIPGRLVFAGQSAVWGGGIAYYDPTAKGTVAGRAYLITCEQLTDVAEQEPRYDEVLRVGEVDARPAYTLAAAAVSTGGAGRDGGRGSVGVRAPAGAYLATLAAGLREAWGWDADRIADYLAPFPGITGAWDRQALVEVAEGVASTPPGP